MIKISLDKGKLNSSGIEREIVPILGVSLDSKERREVLKMAIGLITQNLPASNQARNTLKIIVTPNPEIVYRAILNKAYAQVLNKADLSIMDGIGLLWAKKFLRLENKTKNPLILSLEAIICAFDVLLNSTNERYPGRILFEDLIIEAKTKSLKVYLLGGEGETAGKVAQKLSAKYKDLKIEYSSGPWLNLQGEPADKAQKEIENKAITKINKFRPDLLFVAFGPPKQEFWLERNRFKIKAQVGMSVGGTFDYIAERVPNPPQFISGLGLEWLWRLITQPKKRVARIYTALVKFPYVVFQQKLNQL